MTHEKEYSTVWPTKKNIYRIAINYEYNTVWPTKKNIVQYDPQKGKCIE